MIGKQKRVFQYSSTFCDQSDLDERIGLLIQGCFLMAL
jgi:hypothetical protein